MDSLTDDDLKRYKEFHVFPDAKALIARLEAAEEVCEEFNAFFRDHPGLRFDSAIEVLKAWRKAAGK